MVLVKLNPPRTYHQNVKVVNALLDYLIGLNREIMSHDFQDFRNTLDPVICVICLEELNRAALSCSNCEQIYDSIFFSNGWMSSANSINSEAEYHLNGNVPLYLNTLKVYVNEYCNEKGTLEGINRLLF